MTVPKTQTWEDLARSVAWDYGIELSYREAGHVLWEYTGFPGFWPHGETPREACERQLHEFFEKASA